MSEYGEVITGVSRLETELAHVHPRLHLNAAKIEQLRHDITRAPWRMLYQKVQAKAAQKVAAQNGFGALSALLPNMALCWLLEGESTHLTNATQVLQQLLETTDWDGDPRQHGAAFMGRMLYETALAYDWLYADLPPELRRDLCRALHTACTKQVEVVALRQHYFASASAHNHAGNVLSDITGAALAIYGDAPDVGPLIKVIIDHARLMTTTLGPDGVSPEGICYGGYYADSMTRVLDLLRDLLDVDWFATTPWFANFPLFYLYSQIPRQYWAPRSSHMCFGDGVRYNWYGPSYFLRRLASIYRNPLAQWLAHEVDTAGIAGDVTPALGVLWHDETVPMHSPQNLPLARHFTDNGLVFLRSGWHNDEAVFGFRCGPSSGHHALQHYPGNIGGGHMQPDAGSFQLFAHGDWLISDGGYSYKHTAYRNTILINGHGQTGEGGEWFEDTELRRHKRGPHIERFEPGEQFDLIVADLQQAYDADLGLSRLKRYVIYVKPDCWIIVDEAASETPATFTLCFHADAAFESQGTASWIMSGENGALRLTSLYPHDIKSHVEPQAIESMGAHNGRVLSWLQIANSEPSTTSLFVTALQAYPAVDAGPVAPDLAVTQEGIHVTVNGADRVLRLLLQSTGAGLHIVTLDSGETQLTGAKSE